MKPLPLTSELLHVARRVVWFKEPKEALADPVHFLAHVMTYGTIEDLQALRGVVGTKEFREVLEQAPPGVFDARSWAYWNLKCGNQPTPTMPTRASLLACHPKAAGRPGNVGCTPAPARDARTAPGRAEGQDATRSRQE